MTSPRPDAADGVDMDIDVVLDVNGREHAIRVHAHEPLLTTLRESIGLTSVRGACGIGVCGSCTVLVDGRPVSSCIMLAAQAQGSRITTAEGLRGPGGELSPVQAAFVRCGAYQCSFCIPAATLTVHAALDDPDVGKDRRSMREHLAGNLCRCGSYPEILAAVSELVGDGIDAENSGAPR